MKKTILLTITLLVAVIAVAMLYFSNLSKNTRRSDQALSYIPSDAALVASFRYDDPFNEIFKHYHLFDAIIGDSKATEINQLKSFILQNPSIKGAINDQNFFVSFHSTPNSIDFLWLTTLNDEVDEDIIYKTIAEDSKSLSIKRTSQNDFHIYEITIQPIKKVFYLYLNDGIALGSFSKQLLYKCLDTKTVKIEESFVSEINDTNQKNTNSPVNLFINHRSTSNFYANLFSRKSNGILRLIENFKGYTTLNMNFKSDALMFNGIGSPDTSAKSYLNIFLKQKPVNNTIKNTLPINTAHFLAFGVSDTKQFHSDLKTFFNERGELKDLEQQISRVSSNAGIDLERDLKNLWGKEFAVVQLASQEKFVIIQATNGSKLNFLLEPISTSRSDNVRRFNNSNILYYYFGTPLKEFSRPFYAVIDNYLVIANTVSTVQQVLNNYTLEKTLSKEAEFRKFNQLVANQSNILFFIHNKNSQKVVQSALSKNFSKDFEDEDSPLRNFYGASYQLSAEGDHFFTNLYASYTPSNSEQLKEVWKMEVNGKLVITPQIVVDENNESFILVQDNVNNLYAISPDGKKMWSTQLDNRILGSIFQLDDKSLLFNTVSRIYRIDPSGNRFPGLPLSLPLNASHGGTISGTDPKQLKFFLPCNDRIFAYDASGNLMENWNKTLDGKILFDLKTATFNNTNYLIAGTENGKFYFFNYNGNAIRQVEDTYKRQFRNPLTLEIKNNIEDSRIITTDVTGAIRSIFLDGKMLSKNIGIWSNEHQFDMKNINGDASPELIYLDKDQLSVYRSDSSLVFNYEFPYPITDRPIFFPSTSSFYRLGVASAEDNLLYLFDDDGTLVKGFPFKGGKHFYIGSLKSDGKTYLICDRKDNHLLLYRLK